MFGREKALRHLDFPYLGVLELLTSAIAVYAQAKAVQTPNAI